MTKVTVIGVTMVALLAANLAQADVYEITNGSFEDDGWINDITAQEPNGWAVDLPPGKFRGYVSSDWATDGSHNLTLYSQWWKTFDAGDMATLTQQVDLADANQIVFDLKLETFGVTKWDPNIATAVLLIDEDVVWESNSVGSDIRGEYLDQAYEVENKYRAPGLHSLSLGIRVNVAEMLIGRYVGHWDAFACTYYCGGGGLLDGDFDRDCYVDISDLKLAAEAWLDEVDPDYICNLVRVDDLPGYGTVTFLDFAVYANSWDTDMADLGILAGKWLGEVDLDDQHNLFHADDVKPSGIVNFLDLAIFAENWLASSLEPEQ